MPVQPSTPSPAARRRIHRAGAVVTAAAVLTLGPATSASAHVRVSADSTAAGGYAELTFRVPNESETAGTTGLRVQLPTEAPFTAVRTQPVPGWTATVERSALPEPVVVDGATITEAPTAVTWTAQPGVQIGRGEYQEFAISVGRLPEEGTDLLLPAAQTYSDGSVVDWDQAAPAGGAEPEHPAPTLTTTAAESGHGGASPASADAAAGDGSAAGTEQGSAQRSDTAARWLGGAGLVVAAAALAASVAALVRGRRPAAAGGQPR